MIISDLYQNPGRFRITTILILLLALSGCERKDNYPEVYKYATPDQLDDGWITRSLVSSGIKENPLYEMMNRIYSTQDHNIHSILIIYKGALVFEEYFEVKKFKLGKYTDEYGYDREDLHTLCSVTKSFASALMGIAIDKGYIKSVDERVFDFFPENYDLLLQDPEKSDLTIRYLLTMTSGLQWDDESTSYYDPSNDSINFLQTPIR